MLRKEFTHNRLRVTYQEWGTGINVILCFHGFGRQSADFHMFVDQLRPDQRLISMNLHAHLGSGFTRLYDSAQSIQPEEWIDLMKAFFKSQKIEKCDLIGYSMGGRISLCMWQWLPNHVNAILLLAPDGLKKNMVYRFTSGTYLGRNIFQYFIKKPKLLFSIASFLHTTKLLPPKLFRFLHVHLDTEVKRQLVYDAWIGYRNFFPDLKQLSKIHLSIPIPLSLVFGKNDSVIQPKLSKNLTKHFSTPVNIHIMDSGHRLMNEELLVLLRSKQLWPR